MPDGQDLIARAHQIFSMNGGSWRDYALVADIEPPRIVRTLPSIALLDIEDLMLAEACRRYLFQQGAQTFSSLEELNSALSASSSDNGMTSYSSPAGFYNVEHPIDWKISREENILNIFPPDETGAVTISAFQGNSVSPLAMRGLMERIFKDYEVVSSLNAISLNNWDGLQTELLQSTDSGMRSWLAVGACYRKVMVLITANERLETMPSRRHIYESILNSLVLADPEETGR